MTTAQPHASAQLHQLHQRLVGQGFEVRALDDDLIVIAPPREDGGPRLADVITCLPRPDDDGRPWFFASGCPVDEASHITDAALRIGGRLAGTRADQ